MHYNERPIYVNYRRSRSREWTDRFKCSRSQVDLTAAAQRQVCRLNTASTARDGGSYNASDQKSDRQDRQYAAVDQPPRTIIQGQLAARTARHFNNRKQSAIRIDPKFLISESRFIPGKEWA